MKKFAIPDNWLKRPSPQAMKIVTLGFGIVVGIVVMVCSIHYFDWKLALLEFLLMFAIIVMQLYRSGVISRKVQVICVAMALVIPTTMMAASMGVFISRKPTAKVPDQPLADATQQKPSPAQVVAEPPAPAPVQVTPPTETAPTVDPTTQLLVVQPRIPPVGFTPTPSEAVKDTRGDKKNSDGKQASDAGKKNTISPPATPQEPSQPTPVVASLKPSCEVSENQGDLAACITHCKHLGNSFIDCSGIVENTGEYAEKLAFTEGGEGNDDLYNTDDLPLMRYGLFLGKQGFTEKSLDPHTHTLFHLVFDDQSAGRSTTIKIKLAICLNNVDGYIVFPTAVPIS